MKAVWKFPLETTDEQTIMLPSEAEPLTVQVQHGYPYLWCLVDTHIHTEPRRIRIIGTGHEIGSGFSGKYVGTYQLDNGNFIGHVFLAP